MSLNHDTSHAPQIHALPAPINGDHTPDLVAHRSDHHPNGISTHTPLPPQLHSISPAADSPATPVSSTPAPDVKIDLDYQEQESDVRHEPIPIKSIDDIDDAKHDNVSTLPQLGTPVDPASIPIHPPSGTPPPPKGELLEDVKMAEQHPQHATNGINGTHTDEAAEDVVMADATPDTTPGLAPDASMSSFAPTEPGAQSSLVHHLQDHEDGMPPPAKRARMYSDADRATMAHSATPPPASAAVSDAASPAPPPPSSVPPLSVASSTPGASTLTGQQHRYLVSTVRTLKKLKDASPFLRPVDPVALNIPHYPSVIKHPMDLSTVERKLASSNPQKLDPNPSNPRYYNVEEFVADVRLIFANCLTFNGPDHAITAMGKRVEEVFDKQIKHVPVVAEPKPPVKKVATPPPPPTPIVAPPKKTTTVRRPSTSVPVIRRNDPNEAIGRPKREIHPPPPKDLPYAEPPKKGKKTKRVKDDGTLEQLRFCNKVLADLHKKQYYNAAHPFYEPVDWVKLEIPSYPKIIRKPMDMSTMRKKLDNNEYSNASKFLDDFKLMIRNCFQFNPAGTPVNQAGIELQRIFDDKWKNLPPLHPVEPSDDEEEEDEDEIQRQRTIAEMESQIETMRENLDALKNKPAKEKKKKEKERPVVASTSKAPAKPPKPSTKKASTKKKPIPDDDVLTFDQKKDLSESISKLDGPKLEKVIQIIHEGVPEIRDSTEEIELEIDLLPAAVLTKLYNFVIRPIRQQQQQQQHNVPKRGGRTGKGTGTGGLKRKSMDEDLEAEKIRQLEERMALFEKKEGTAAPLPTHREVESEQSSDSSSDESSGSDSD